MSPRDNRRWVLARGRRAIAAALAALALSGCFPERTIPLSADGGIRIEALESAIRAYSVRSVDELLPLLPEAFRRHYVLVAQSRSLQFGGADHPRVVFFGDSARTLLAFSGEPSAAGGNSVEVTEWNPSKQGFEYTEIRFPGAASAASPTVERNPKICLSCHRDPPRPNWDSYPLWRPVYGMQHAYGGPPPPGYGKPDRRGRTLSANFDGVGSPRQLGYLDFMRTFRQRGRYTSLLPPVELPLGAPSHIGWVADGAGTEPANDLSVLLNDLNNRRIVAQILAVPGYERYKYAVAGLALHCFDFGRIENFFPAPERRRGPSLKSERAEVTQTARQQLDLRLQSVRGLSGQAENDSRLVTVLNADIPLYRYVMDRAGIDMKGWSMVPFDEGTYVFQSEANDAFGAECGGFEAMLLAALALRNDPQLAPLSEGNLRRLNPTERCQFGHDRFVFRETPPEITRENACAALASKSLSRLEPAFRSGRPGASP